MEEYVRHSFELIIMILDCFMMILSMWTKILYSMNLASIDYSTIIIIACFFFQYLKSDLNMHTVDLNAAGRVEKELL